MAADAGGWFVVGASTDVGTERSVVRVVDGVEITLWRDVDGSLLAGPGSCPHLGALLTGCEVMQGEVYCRWHGLALGREGWGRWRTFPAYDDGVLLWVRRPVPGETPTERPMITPRPPLERSISAVVALAGVCEPRDVIANRLDPWHGSWFHPYAFSHLEVDEGASSDDRLVVDVTFRLSRTWGVPVRATFTTPDRRTIVMTIVDGEGTGSVVETHATPLGPDEHGRPRTMVTEATVAHSGRPGFAVARRLQALVRPAMRRTASRLWVDDLVYAERRYEVRRRGEFR
ncbi:Rieske 2Fe-2S domain-containing protein [Auraticoccus sp. F435]|uniref:Rieske 2Fe-2S domain-containing protein n=2 Tax=Auraticoccus cholistanensis TaxID=2656650 RepID=A0A6A9UVK8_9ACTN|nr:DUF5914 domain-containing protein [Auraticoccus cholistanensis]MVA75247.1 Rieske 2Fe-2S domain-containing protein [Auraticoccus cholistanensis]